MQTKSTIRSQLLNKIKDLHLAGISNRKIARQVGHHHTVIGKWLKELGLKPHGHVRTEALLIRGDLGRCTRCRIFKDLKFFGVIRPHQKDSYRLTYCNQCRAQAVKDRINSSPELYIRHRFNVWKSKARRQNITFRLTLQYLKNLIVKQHERCFYTNISLYNRVHNVDSQQYSLSLDRVIPSRGYVEGNVVFCINKINRTKGDLSLEELRAWMPPLYKRIKACSWLNINKE